MGLIGVFQVMNKDVSSFCSALNNKYPITKTFLNYNTDWQLLFAIILSAQTKDSEVNRVTSILYKRFPNLTDYNSDNLSKIQNTISSIGLHKSKTKYIIETASLLINKYNGIVPKDRNVLISFPGVGFKTSGVFLAEFYNEKLIPVDTHIRRVSIRLGFANEEDDNDKIELELEKVFSSFSSCHIHRQLILIGREYCLPINPDCLNCPINSYCKKNIKEYYLYSIYLSPFGYIIIYSKGEFLLGLSFIDDKEIFLKKIYQEYKNKFIDKESKVIKDTKKWLDLYFAKKIPQFTPKLLIEGSQFYKDVCYEMLKIPYGQTRSYKEIANSIANKYQIRKMSSEAVGSACSKNKFPLIIPCHRVIKSNGEYGNYYYGKEMKSKLLNLEKDVINK